MKFSDLGGLGIPSGVFVVLAGLWGLFALLVNVVFAIAVYQDAERNLRPKKRVLLVSPFTWALTALFTSVIGVGVYWVMHHSSLRAPAAPAET